MSAFIAPPPRRETRIVPLCLCRAAPQATCPAHPTRERGLSRAQLLRVALFCLGVAAAGLWLLMHPWVGVVP